MTRLTSGIVALVLVTPLVQQVDRERAFRDAEWIDQFRGRAYDALMPLNIPGLRAAYRTDPGMRWDEVEQYFAITLASASDRLEATVVAPIGGTITRQLLNQFHRDVKASFESILVRVSVRRFMVDSAACPAIRSQMSALSKLNVSLQDDGLLRVDHTVHRIAVWWSAGEIDARMDDEGHPLVRWAAETHKALLACGRASGLGLPLQ